MVVASKPLAWTFVYKAKPAEQLFYSLDVFFPSSRSDETLKALVYFHGGGLTGEFIVSLSGDVLMGLPCSWDSQELVPCLDAWSVVLYPDEL